MTFADVTRLMEPATSPRRSTTLSLFHSPAEPVQLPTNRLGQRGKRHTMFFFCAIFGTMQHKVDVDEEAANEIMESTAPVLWRAAISFWPLIDLASSGDGHRFFCFPFNGREAKAEKRAPPWAPSSKSKLQFRLLSV